MKKSLAALLVTIMTAISSGFLYPDTGIITEIDNTQDTVAIEMTNGNIFEFYGVEDYAEGDLVSLIMWSNGTEEVYDDEILCHQYSGTVNMFAEIERQTEGSTK